ncbi:MAG: dihydropteroate synthase [Frankiales bacterium]|jgi:dihydropteroate synthase|nr:dihydropteroate synthase [Frankiales bacterium]
MTALAGFPVLDRCRVFAIINVTPDSFSDGGQHADAAAAVRHGLAMLSAGADVLDVGGESTRPGAVRVSEQTEIGRVLPVVEALAAAGAIVSVDTMRSGVARAALEAGARIVNDVSGGLADPELPKLVAEAGVPYVLMHWRGHSETMQEHAVYRDVVAEVLAELEQRVEAVVAAGVSLDQIVLDPGIGFAKTAEHNWTLLAQLPALLELGRPVMVGASRKAFLGRLVATDPDVPRPVDEREDATTAVTALAAHAGAWAVRVHEAQPAADAVLVAQAVRAHERSNP